MRVGDFCSVFLYLCSVEFIRFLGLSLPVGWMGTEGEKTVPHLSLSFLFYFSFSQMTFLLCWRDIVTEIKAVWRPFEQYWVDESRVDSKLWKTSSYGVECQYAIIRSFFCRPKLSVGAVSCKLYMGA